MNLQFKCACGQKLAAPVNKMGGISRCPTCQRTIKIPKVNQSPPQVPQIDEPVDHVPKPKRKPSDSTTQEAEG